MKKFVVILFAALTFSSAMASNNNSGVDSGVSHPTGSRGLWAG